MTELFDTSGIRDDDAHWDAVARRVAARASMARATGAIGWVASSRAALAAASILLVATVAAMLLSPRGGAVPNEPAWSDALAPTDAVGRAVTAAERPPSIGTLLVGGRGGV